MTQDGTDFSPAWHAVTLAVDSVDPGALARFWAALLGGTAQVDSDGDATVLAPNSLTIDFLRVPEVKTVKNRLHLDLRAVSYDDAVAAALRLGATRADDIHDGGEWQVLRDPEGHEFCILRPSVAR